MKTYQKVLATALSLAFYAPLLSGQTGNHVSIQLGSVKVWLGEDYSTAKRDFAAAKMIFNPNAHDGNRVSVVDSEANHLYTLQFESGELIYADRDDLPPFSAR